MVAGFVCSLIYIFDRMYVCMYLENKKERKKRRRKEKKKSFFGDQEPDFSGIEVCVFFLGNLGLYSIPSRNSDYIFADGLILTIPVGF